MNILILTKKIEKSSRYLRMTFERFLLPWRTSHVINKYNVSYGTERRLGGWVGFGRSRSQGQCVDLHVNHVEEDLGHEVNVLISFASCAALLLVCLLTCVSEMTFML